MHDAPLHYSARAGEQPGTMILTLAGPLTLANLFALQTELRALQAKVLILDMGQTDYMDSAGLGLIMNAYTHAQNAGGKLLLAGVNDRVATLFALTRVDGVLSLYPSVEAAESSL